MNSPTDRYHSLDALRAFALLLGVVFHSALCWVLPPGLWAAGTTRPSAVLGWFVYYAHSFRLELFFLLAGFFAALVIEKRGMRTFLRDRFRRILLVFLVALYPMKLLLAGVWVAGGLHGGWLQLPPEAAGLPWWQLSLGGLALESWPDIQLTHLWFLYYLAVVTALFLSARRVIGRWFGRLATPGPALRNRFRHVLSARWLPLALAVMTTPLLALMRGPDVDTPDSSFSWRWPVLSLYALFFSLGWGLFRQRELLGAFATRWRSRLIIGVVLSGAGWLGVAMHYVGGPWANENSVTLKWATSFLTSLTMGFSVSGWLGCFVRFFDRPSGKVRYVADASYWIYLAHLPLVMALQVVVSRWGLPWWVALPLLNAVVFTLLLLSYHFCVRFTWVGAWLNGRRSKRRGDTKGFNGSSASMAS